MFLSHRIFSLCFLIALASCNHISKNSDADQAVSGFISIHDQPVGWASVQGGTTGGGTDLANAVSVSDMSALKREAESAGSKIILLAPGNYEGTLSPKAHKSIIGTAPGVTLHGSIEIEGADSSNIIIRNIAVRGLPCATYQECRAGSDAIHIGDGAHHIWIDHVDIADGQDGNLDVTKQSDFVTISWAKFHYTYDKEHRFSNLIASRDSETESRGKLNVTFMNSWWAQGVDTRQPRGRFGKVHMLNNYHSTNGGQIHGVGLEMALIAENNVYEETRSIWKDMGNPTGWKGIGNIGTAKNMNEVRGSAFTIPYSYTAMPASEVKAAVTSPNCGAGNTCYLQEMSFSSNRLNR